MSEKSYDIVQAKHFLRALDPGAEKFCFQLFQKTKSGETQKPPVLNTLEGLERVFADNQAKGFNVTVTLSETSSASRKLDDMRRLRAFFIDFDSKQIGQELKYGKTLKKVIPEFDMDKLMNWDFPPHIVVQSSPGNYHAYWFIQDDNVALNDVDREKKSKAFHDMQLMLAYYFGTDPGVCAFNQCVRVPGYWRFKEDDGAEPSLVTILHREDDIIRYLPATMYSVLREQVIGPTRKPKQQTQQEEYNEDPQPDSREYDDGEQAASDEARAEAQAWLTRVCKDLADLAEGGRDTYLNEICWTAGGYIAGGALDEEIAKKQIEEAALECGLDRSRIRDKLSRVIRQGMQKPIRRDPQIIAITKPNEVAYKYLKTQHLWKTADKESYTIVYNGDYWVYESGQYKKYTEINMRQDIMNWLRRMKRKIKKNDDEYVTVPFSPTSGHVEEILKQVKMIVTLPAGIYTNEWIEKRRSNEHASNLVFFTNGMYNLRTGELTDSDPGFFNSTAVQCSYDTTVGEPVEWMRFLESAFTVDGVYDEESVRLLQEWMGYILTPDCSMHTMMLVIGPPRCGKGTINGVIKNILENVGSFSFDMFEGSHGTEGLLDTTLATAPDFRDEYAGKQRVVSTLLSIIANDAIPINPKGKQIVTRKLNTRLMIYANEAPSFNDPSGAMMARLRVIKMRNSFVGQEDRTLATRLEAETQQIAMWALEGLHNLNMVGSFTQPESSGDLIREIRNSDTPVLAFQDEVLQFGNGFCVGKTALYNMYNEWRERNGYFKSVTATKFARDFNMLNGHQVSLKQCSPNAANGQCREQYYVGVAHKNDPRPDEFPKTDLQYADPNPY